MYNHNYEETNDNGKLSLSGNVIRSGQNFHLNWEWRSSSDKAIKNVHFLLPALVLRLLTGCRLEQSLS